MRLGNLIILLAKRFAGVEALEEEMTSVDRLGFHVRLKRRTECMELALRSCGK